MSGPVSNNAHCVISVRRTSLGRKELLLLLCDVRLSELLVVTKGLHRRLLLVHLLHVLLMEGLHLGGVLLALRVQLLRQPLHRCPTEK